MTFYQQNFSTMASSTCKKNISPKIKTFLTSGSWAHAWACTESDNEALKNAINRTAMPSTPATSATPATPATAEESRIHVAIPLKKIAISSWVRDAVLSYNPDFDFSGYFVYRDGTFNMYKMGTMLDDRLFGTCERPPIYVLPAWKTDIDASSTHTILDGRHRVARALLLGHECINAFIGVC